MKIVTPIYDEAFRHQLKVEGEIADVFGKSCSEVNKLLK
jgi:hypothetical protein